MTNKLKNTINNNYKLLKMQINHFESNIIKLENSRNRTFQKLQDQTEDISYNKNKLYAYKNELISYE